jgi:methionyl-tRNA formyltransferase
MLIGFFGDGIWAQEALNLMQSLKNANTAFVCGRHPNPDIRLKQLADEIGVPFLEFSDVNDSESLEVLSGYGCDIFVSIAYNQIFRKHVIDLPPMGIINCHAGKLPFYRGRNILNWALINDETEFGITVHYVDEGIDTGDIILQRTYPITDNDNYSTLLNRAHDECALVVNEALEKLNTGEAMRLAQTQVHPIGSYCVARRPGDENLDWNQSSRRVFNFVRAVCPPGPGARTWLRDREMIVRRVEEIRDAAVYIGVPGSVVGKGADYFDVKTVDSMVRITDWEYEGPVKIGDRFSDK